jgi:hypothetical protein
MLDCSGAGTIALRVWARSVIPDVREL